MAVRKRSRFRKPRAVYLIHWIFEFTPSDRALVAPRTIALRMPFKWLLIIWATRRTGSRRERMAQENQANQPRRAQPRVRYCQRLIANSLIAQARAVFSALSRRGSKACQVSSLRWS